ncbi:MAG: transposase, partial [Armatimonadaceae bacterium]
MHASIRRPRGRPRRNDPTGIAPVEPPPCTRDEALEAFVDEDYAFRLIVGLRWPGGINCPHCQGADPGYLTTRQIWKCRVPECRRQFSVRVDTLLEDSPIRLGQWLCTLWLFANEPNGISSYALREMLGVTQKTGWLMLRRIRIATERASLHCLTGDDNRTRFLTLTRTVL